MVSTHPLDIFPLSPYKREDRHNMEMENIGTKLCSLNTNDYDKIQCFNFVNTDPQI
jgi:hypothetical protein